MLPEGVVEVTFGSEVYFVSEVSPDGEVANLTSLLLCKNFTAYATSL